MTLVIGRRSSAVSWASSLEMDIVMYGSQDAMMASEYVLRSTERSFPDVCSEWQPMPRHVPNSRNARRYLILRSR